MKWLLPDTNDLTWVPTTALICFLIAAGLLTYVVFRKNSKNNFELEVHKLKTSLATQNRIFLQVFIGSVWLVLGLMISINGFANMIDLGQIEIEGEVRQPMVNAIDSRTILQEAIRKNLAKQVKALEEKLLQPSENEVDQRSQTESEEALP